MSYDRNKFPFRGIIGARGIGKTYSQSNLLAIFFKKVKKYRARHALNNPNDLLVDDLFIWSRLTMDQLAGMSDNFLKPEIQKKYKIKTRMVAFKKGSAYKIYFNDILMGHGLALQNAPKYKGLNWEWQRYKYFILDEFQRERNERRTFDIVYNLRSILESVCRFTTRIEEGYDIPYVIFMGNTVDEAIDLLLMFDFMPLKYGIYKLPAKQAIIEYIDDSKKYKETQKINPLNVLSKGDDFTFGERKLKVRDKILDWGMVGQKKYLGHLQITDYLRFEVWSIQKGGIYITNDHPTKKFENTVYTLRRLSANKGTFYSVDFHKLIRHHYDIDRIYFDKRITASIFNQNIV